MFGIGLPEFLLLCVGGLLVLGPKRLPETLRTLGLWHRRLTSSWRTLRWELERELPEQAEDSAVSSSPENESIAGSVEKAPEPGKSHESTG